MYGTLKVIVTDRYIVISLFVIRHDIYRGRLLEYFSSTKGTKILNFISSMIII